MGDMARDVDDLGGSRFKMFPHSSRAFLSLLFFPSPFPSPLTLSSAMAGKRKDMDTEPPLDTRTSTRPKSASLKQREASESLSSPLQSLRT